jgi:hypothetical protein
MRPLQIVANDGRSLSRIATLTPQARAILKAIPLDVRLGLPLLQGDLNPYALWIDQECSAAKVRSLCSGRFEAALGQVRSEADITSTAKSLWAEVLD